MSRLELVSVETDTKKTYGANDKFVFSITFNALENIPDDAEFEMHYFGDAYSDRHDQKIGSALIGPFEEGKQRFDLETELIDLTKIPIKTLFGLTTILIVGKYKGQQFLRIGYVVNVSYPGLDQDVLADSDDKPLNEEQDDEEGSNPEEEEEEIEVMDDEELDEEEQLNDDEDEQSDEDEEEPIEDEEDIAENEESQAPINLEEMLTEALRPKHDREPIPLETPIVADKDEFEYKGIAMKKSKIEMTLLERPIIHLFDINWDAVEKTDEINESTEETNKKAEISVDEAPAKRRQIGESSNYMPANQILSTLLAQLPSHKMIVGVCCAMNQNRSMSIHKKLADACISVKSYGISDVIRLPGSSPDEFNSYSYGTSYKEMIDDLTAKNKAFYTEIGIIKMLKRNSTIKEAPEYFFGSTVNNLDILISCDSRCFDKIFERFGNSHGKSADSNCIILGFEINDTLEDAQEEAETVCSVVEIIKKEMDDNKALKYAVEAGMIYYTNKKGESIQCGFLRL